MPTSKKSKPPLSWAIEHATTFRRSPKGGFVAGFKGFTRGVTYSEDDFNTLDPRYLSVYKTLKADKRLQPYGLNPTTTGHLFRMSQLYWTTPHPKLFSNTEISDRVVITVNSVKDADYLATGSALLMVESFEVVTLLCGTKCGNNWLKVHKVRIKHEQLELWYPGCVQKMRAALDMGVDPKDAASLIFRDGATIATQPLPEDFSIDYDCT